eukprot:755743-Hanusia_phi.AAC.4
MVSKWSDTTGNGAAGVDLAEEDVGEEDDDDDTGDDVGPVGSLEGERQGKGNGPPARHGNGQVGGKKRERSGWKKACDARCRNGMLETMIEMETMVLVGMTRMQLN